MNNGSDSEHSLIVRGWQRSGALIALFALHDAGVLNAKFARPAYLFAASPDAEGADHSDRSRREEETLGGLSEKLSVDLNLSFGKGQEVQAAEAAAACDGPVLIAWDHKKITTLARALAPDQLIPEKWPGDRFDMVFVFRLQDNGTYAFTQVPQLLLAGDTDQPIAAD